MKKQNTIHIVSKVLKFLTLAVVLYACNPEDVLISVEPAPSKLVVASQILPGDFVGVLVTRSFSALEGNEDTLSTDFLNRILVRNAEVNIESNGQIFPLPPSDDIDGLYVTDTAIDLNADSLHLTVVDIEMDLSVRASTPVLEQIAPDTIRFVETVVDEDTTHTLIFSFTDPPTPNWYAVNLFDPISFADGLTNNPFSFVGGNNGLFYEDLISDQQFEVPMFSDTVKLDSLIRSDTVAFLFSNVSEGYFRFLDSRQRTGGIIASATSEPINHPTNVSDGFGYFNAHRPSIDLVIKERE